MHPTFSRVLLAAALAAAGSPAVATEIQLEQGWNAEQRASWYDASLGSRLLPLAWAQALERPDSEERLFSEDNARRLGFPLRNWQGGELRLPRGFALDQQDDSQFSDTRLRWKARQSSSEPWVGLNCAGCHSTDISYRGSELTVDAGATLANVQAIFDEVLAALRRTSDDGDKFARFAGNVLGSEDSPANRELLKAALVKRAALIDTLLSMSATDLQPGPGRLDATGQSLNRAAINSGARHLQANPTDAPTSFPALWHTLQMDKLQSSGFVPNVKVLDLNGQVFDLGYLAGDIGVVQGDYGDVVSHPLSGLEGYISSIRVDNLTRVEGLIHKLKAPAWPSQLFGAPDSARLAQGKRLYEENCAACHASIGRDDLQTPIKVRQVRLKAHGDDAPIGTDPWMACNTFTFSSPSGNYFGLFRPSLGTPSGVGIVGRTSKIADMQVPEVFQIMLGKKGQLATASRDHPRHRHRAADPARLRQPASGARRTIAAGRRRPCRQPGAEPHRRRSPHRQECAQGLLPEYRASIPRLHRSPAERHLGHRTLPAQRFGAVAVRPAAAPGATAGHLLHRQPRVRSEPGRLPHRARPGQRLPFRHPPGRQLQRRPRLRPRVRRKPAPGAARIPQDPVSRPRPHAQ